MTVSTFTQSPKIAWIITILKNEWIAALVFTLLMIGWEALVFQINYADFLEKTTSGGNLVWDTYQTRILIGTIIVSLVLTFLFIWASLRSGWRTRIVCLVLFLLAVQYEYGYYKVLGRFSTAEDLLMAVLYSRDSRMMADAVLLGISWAALLPIGLFGLMLWKIPPRPRTYPIRIVAVLALSFVFYWYVFPVWYLTQIAFPTTSFSGFMRAAIFAPLKIINSYDGPRDQLTYKATTKPNINIVFVVDESIRGDHLSLNGYSRPTTPYLEELAKQGMLYNWGDGMSGATCSYQSNNLLLTGVTELPDTEGRVQRQPSIFQYAQAMGFTTYYIDPTNSIFWNGTQDDLRYIDHWETESQFTNGPLYEADRLAAARIHSIITGSTGNFIWINKRGVHWLYNNTFPPNQAIWTPLISGRYYDPGQRVQTINSYDNGILYNFESFFHALIPDPAILEHTMIVYTADHAQTLSEKGESWSHCKNTYNEARVPLFMLARQGMQVDTGYKASHSNLFATLLDLFEYPDAERKYTYMPSLLRTTAADSQRRRFYAGELATGSPNDWQWYDP